MRLPKFDYFVPKTLEAALTLLAEHGEGAHLVAGGTDLVVKMIHGRLTPKAVIALPAVEGMTGIRFDADKGLVIGAGAKLAEVASSPEVISNYPALAHAVQCMANVEVRNMGT
ncbi:MAG: FAD binding domain-containing protein, partial [Pseudomonadota bacterium]